MKKEIHPNYNEKVIAKCACGHSFEVGSTMESINVEVCSNCHPFYTGEERVIDTAGRVEKFKARREAAATIKKATKPKVKRVTKKKEEEVVETAK